MLFFWKRYVHTLAARKKFLWLLLIPSLLYLILAAFIPNSFTIEQRIEISEKSMLKLGKKPGSTVPMRAIVSKPDLFFLDEFAVLLLQRSLENTARDELSTIQANQLRSRIGKSLTLFMDGENRAVLRYQGEDLQLGQAMILFYSKRLLGKLAGGAIKGVGSEGPVSANDRLLGQAAIEKHYTLLTSERIYIMLLIFLASVVLFLIALAIIEFKEPSFKSERQVARYLELPILGSLPNLEKLSSVMTDTSG